jgi:AraC-like DNA-binding protein
MIRNNIGFISTKGNSVSRDMAGPHMDHKGTSTESGSSSPRCVFDHLFRLSAHRDVFSGFYSLGSLVDTPAREEHTYIKASHERIFAEWLSLSLTQKIGDLNLFLSMYGNPTTVAATWLRLESYLAFIPLDATHAARKLYAVDLRIILSICRREGKLSSAPLHRTPFDRRVASLLELLDTGREPCMLNVITKNQGLSARYIGKLFRDEVGLSFHEYSQGVRMQRAGYLLYQTQMLIKQVAAETGYTDSSNFIHDFRHFYGCTPSEYRKAVGKGPCRDWLLVASRASA